MKSAFWPHVITARRSPCSELPRVAMDVETWKSQEAAKRFRPHTYRYSK